MGQERGERLFRDTMERGWGLLLEVVLVAGDEEEQGSRQSGSRVALSVTRRTHLSFRPVVIIPATRLYGIGFMRNRAVGSQEAWN